MTKIFKRAHYRVAIQYGLVNHSNQKQSSQTLVNVCGEHVWALEKLLFIVIKYVIEMNQLQMQTLISIVKGFISLCFPKMSKINNALICENVLLDYLLVLLYFSCAAPSSACEGLLSDNLF